MKTILIMRTGEGSKEKMAQKLTLEGWVGNSLMELGEIPGRGNCVNQGKEAGMWFFLNGYGKKELNLGNESNRDSEPAKLWTNSTIAQTHLLTFCTDQPYCYLLVEFRVKRRAESVFEEGWPQWWRRGNPRGKEDKPHRFPSLANSVPCPERVTGKLHKIS